MFQHHYLRLAVEILDARSPLTTLMVIAIGAGMGASMTTLAVFRAMSGDPLPAKSHQLFVGSRKSTIGGPTSPANKPRMACRNTSVISTPWR